MAEETLARLRCKSLALPNGPGVYLFKDLSGRLLYVGKANSLKKRVATYFSGALSAKTQALVDKISDIDFILTGDESRARILEAALIKEKQPHYNVSLKDDKSFPFIKIGSGDFPIVLLSRSRGNPEPGAVYFGPYPDARAARRTLKILRVLFGFRSCRNMPAQPCLYKRLQLCPAPCSGEINVRDYAAVISRIKLFLEGNYEKLIFLIGEQMDNASGEYRFEEAAKLRDKMDALSSIRSGDNPVVFRKELDDLVALLKLPFIPEIIEAFDISCTQGRQPCGSMVSFRSGKPDKHNYRRFSIKRSVGMDDFAMLREVVNRRYSRLLKEGSRMPDLIVIDGGRGQVSSACLEMHKLRLSAIPLIGIAKPERSTGTKRSTRRSKEKIYLSDGKAIELSAERPALNLLRRLRDEAHRFAVSYHRLLRKKRMFQG